MWVYFNVPESEYLKYAQNNPSNKQTPVRLKLADGSIYEHQGVIDAIEADFDNHTGTIEMRASFPNPDQLLRHGQTGNVMVDIIGMLWNTYANVLEYTYIYIYMYMLSSRPAIAPPLPSHRVSSRLSSGQAPPPRASRTHVLQWQWSVLGWYENVPP